MSREMELKLILDPAGRKALADTALLSGSRATVRILDATYFDTADHALRAAGYSLRVRRERGRHVQTIKSAGGGAGLFVRMEWEHEVDDGAPALHPADDPLHGVLRPEQIDALLPIFRTVVRREKRIVERGGARVEIAIDSGKIVAGDRSEPLCELEMELLSGKAGVLFDMARKLDAAAPLRLSVLSKPEQGYRLVEDGEEKAIKAAPVDLSSVNDSGIAFTRIAEGCIRQFRLNEDIFQSTGSPESLHQMRVAIRRLRSAFRLFRPMLKGGRNYRPLAAALKELGAVLGELRDIDVVMAHLAHQDRERLSAAREEARETVAMTLRLARTRHLMLDLAEWLALPDWREHAERADRADVPLAAFASDALRRCRRQLKRAGKNWADLDAGGRHEVRKKAKTLRYATEFFASLFAEGKAGKRQVAFRDALAELQDELGALNDLEVAPILLERFGMTGVLPAPPKRERQAKIDAAGRKLAALLDRNRFWTGKAASGCLRQEETELS